MLASSSGVRVCGVPGSCPRSQMPMPFWDLNASISIFSPPGTNTGIFPVVIDSTVETHQGRLQHISTSASGREPWLLEPSEQALARATEKTR